MAGPRIRRNLFLGGKNKLARAFIKENSILAVFCSSTPAPAQALALTLAAGLLGRYTNKDLQRATKLALELFVKSQEHSQL